MSNTNKHLLIEFILITLLVIIGAVLEQIKPLWTFIFLGVYYVPKIMTIVELRSKIKRQQGIIKYYQNKNQDN